MIALPKAEIVNGFASSFVHVSPTEELFMIGKTLGEFKIIKELGRGGSGVVYLAEHQKLKKKYALNVLPEDLADNKAFLDRLRAEGRVLLKLNHPNIVKLINVGKKANLCVLVTEYVESGTGAAKKPRKTPI